MMNPPPNPFISAEAPLPPETPSLSAFSADGGEAGGWKAGALPRLFFQVEQQLDTIARAVPQSSGEIDSIKQSLRGILVSSLQGKRDSVGPSGSGLSTFEQGV